ncbi:MAG: GerAB/ArcD/ProY family transporter [Clostridiales bacterium]|nr:GerAB/ArcD/ProY family transporter [Clostridiales bacterium]
MENETSLLGKPDLQATSRQLISAIFVLSLAAKMFLQPISLIHAVGRDAYIAMAIDGLIDLVALGLLIAAIRISGENDFFSMLVRLVGKTGAKVIAVIIGLYFFFKLSVTTSETLVFYTDSLFAEFDISVMIVVLLVFLVAVASHTLKAMSRLIELFVPLVVVGIGVLATIVIATKFDIANILPFLHTDKFGHALYTHIAFTGDFTPLIFFVGRTKSKKRTTLFSALSGVFGTFVAFFFTVVMSAAFGNVPILSDTSTNLSTALQFSIGNVYGRIDLFSTVLWSIAAFLETALFFFAASKCFCLIVGEKGHGLVGLAVAVALYFVEVFAMTDPTILKTVLTSHVTSMICLCFTIAIPLSALIISIISRDDGKKTDTKEQKKSGVMNEN